MSPVNWRRSVAGAAICALTVTTMALAPTAASADVIPGNESDIGVYTNGQTDSMDIGDPTYLNVDEVAQKLAPGVDWTAGSMHGRIFDKDLAWNIRALFCGPLGPNLRNRVAHGLVTRAEAESTASIYAWFFAFRLAFVPYFNAVRGGGEAVDAGSAGKDADGLGAGT